MTRGRKPDLPILHVLRGTAPAGAAAAPPAAPGDVPSPPAWLDARAAALWGRLCPLLAVGGELREGNLAALALLCALHARLVRAFEADVLPGAAHIAQFRGLAADLGLTGAVQTPSVAPKPRNRFETNGRPVAGNPKGTP